MVRQKLAVELLAVALAAICLSSASARAGKASAAGSQQPFPFPVTVTAANGKVTLKRRPVQIVSLSPTATEDLFAFGAGRQVIAVDDQSNYPARLAEWRRGAAGGAGARIGPGGAAPAAR
jgi:iron complex transport system substrate-binding protein